MDIVMQSKIDVAKKRGLFPYKTDGGDIFVSKKDLGDDPSDNEISIYGKKLKDITTEADFNSIPEGKYPRTWGTYSAIPPVAGAAGSIFLSPILGGALGQAGGQLLADKLQGKPTSLENLGTEAFIGGVSGGIGKVLAPVGKFIAGKMGEGLLEKNLLSKAVAESTEEAATGKAALDKALQQDLPGMDVNVPIQAFQKRNLAKGIEESIPAAKELYRGLIPGGIKKEISQYLGPETKNLLQKLSNDEWMTKFSSQPTEVTSRRLMAQIVPETEASTTSGAQDLLSKLIKQSPEKLIRTQTGNPVADTLTEAVQESLGQRTKYLPIAEKIGTGTGALASQIPAEYIIEKLRKELYKQLENR